VALLLLNTPHTMITSGSSRFKFLRALSLLLVGITAASAQNGMALLQFD